MTLKIDKELFQWETNRYLTVEASKNDPKISTIQFYNKRSLYAPEVPIINNQAKIPNFLLTESLPIVAVACVKKDNSTQVITRRTFKVLSRVKPEFYFDEDSSSIEVIYDGGEEI